MLFKGLEFNEETIREDFRRLGVVMISAGLIHGILEGGDPLVAVFLALSGFFSLVLGNLRYTQ